jgi:hypothetical protein
MRSLTVTGAYGRDYSNATDALRDWKNGKDFLIAGTRSYVNLEDALHNPEIKEIRIRYAKLSKVTIIDLETPPDISGSSNAR